MAAINDLISQIQDETLRNRIQEEVSKMAKQKKFGLVFEEHMPESTPLYDMPIKRGCNVMRRDSKDDKSISCMRDSFRNIIQRCSFLRMLWESSQQTVVQPG